MRNKRNAAKGFGKGGASRYSLKKARGQMYGPGCGANFDPTRKAAT